MPTDLKTILQLKVPLIVEIGRRPMTLDEVLNLAPGAILELNKPADHELSFLVNNKPIATGKAVKVGENFGIRISQIDAPRDRIHALGAGASAQPNQD